MVDFKALLEKRVAEAERPKPLPPGVYIAVITEHTPGESQKKKTPYIRFSYRILAAHSEVDEAALAEMKNWNERKLYQDFYLTPDALWRLREHIEKVGVDFGSRTFAEALPDTLNKQIGIVVTQEASQKEGDDAIYNRIGDFVKLDN